MLKILGRALRHDQLRRRLVVEAMLTLGYVRLHTLVMPFKHVAKSLAKNRATMSSKPPDEAPLINDITWAVGAAARHVPWKAVCLYQAMAAKRMLARRGIASTLHIGAARREGQLNGHAWLSHGERIIIGADGAGEYSVLSSH